ncbi:MAG: hypothetical protein FIA96_06030, partial [Betaproteobacteria bacterium]|nr:hypothetical protein [Betaproteobacteria bacterium]
MDKSCPAEFRQPTVSIAHDILIGISMKTPCIPIILASGLALALGGCAVAPTAPSVMVLPGSQKSADQFHTDAVACQQQAQALLANDAEAANNQAVTSAAIGTVIGAAAGALIGQGSHNPSAAAGWGAGTGLLIGSSVGGGNSQASSYSLQQRFDIAYMQCMYLRGNQVPGQVNYRRQAPVTSSPNYPPPANYPPPN